MNLDPVVPDQTIVLLQALAVRPPGPGPGGGPHSGLQLIGSPHTFCLLLCLLLYFYARSTARGDDRTRQKWIEWGLIAGMLSVLLTLALRAHGPAQIPIVPPLGMRLLETLPSQIVSVTLAAGFMRYLLDQRQPAQKYWICSMGALGATALMVMALGPAGRPPHPIDPSMNPFHLHGALDLVGFTCLAVGLALAYRLVHGGERRLMLAALGCMAATQLSSLVGGMVLYGPSPRPAYPLVLTFSSLTLLILTHLFIRQRAKEIHTDLALLEGRVSERTKELKAALGQLAEANSLLEQQSNVDVLTGAGNRRSFNDALAEEWSRARRTGQPITVAMVDLDRFKEINDIHGHPVGDQCLSGLASALQNAARRPPDLVARLGGDEFAVLLPETSGEAAAQSLDDVRLQASMLTSTLAPDLAMTISVGVASCVPSAESAPEDLVRQADNALYKAKRSGRNKVVLSESGALQVL